MRERKKTLFCRHLAAWLSDTDWHFTTLLATCIESIELLPDDIDQVINKLLQSCPVKPDYDEILRCLSTNTDLANWFDGFRPDPVIRYRAHFEFNQLNGRQDKLPALGSSSELASWLGITTGQLDWIADFRRGDTIPIPLSTHYHYQLLEKKRGGLRLIESPKPLLKQVQKKINRDILSRYPIHEACHGFCPQRNCLTHASNHVGKKYLMLFDIANCFQSIQWPSINQAFQRMGYPKQVAHYLAWLSTHQINENESILNQLDTGQSSLLTMRHLTQGAPCSPMLSNIVMYQLDKRLAGLAKSIQFDYSRYADDIAFSGNQIRDWQKLESIIGAICLEQGFTLNYRKTRILKPQQRQKLTGIVVNQKPNIDGRDYDCLKAILHNCMKQGLESQNRNNHEHFRAHLLGRINHVTSINVNKGLKLKALYDRIAG